MCVAGKAAQQAQATAGAARAPETDGMISRRRRTKYRQSIRPSPSLVDYTVPVSKPSSVNLTLPRQVENSMKKLKEGMTRIKALDSIDQRIAVGGKTYKRRGRSSVYPTAPVCNATNCVSYQGGVSMAICFSTFPRFHGER